MCNLVGLDARAVRATVAVVARITDGDLSRPTPCAGWVLGDLLAHMTVQHDGFAAAAAGRGADPDVWLPSRREWESARAVASAYRVAADGVLAAFRADGVLDREFALPIGFHLVDYVTHGWDVARSLGLAYELDQDLIDAALAIARAVPDDDRRGKPGSAFAPRVLTPAAGLAEIVALLGRPPGWPALP
jgi:uncharacterized protein (TIGR03086 family)